MTKKDAVPIRARDFVRNSRFVNPIKRNETLAKLKDELNELTDKIYLIIISDLSKNFVPLLVKKRKKMQSKNLTCTEEVRVRFNETDPLGIVWHGHYIVYFEDGREAFGRQHGLTYLDIQKAGFVTPIVKSTCEHFLPLKYGETFNIVTTFVNSVSAKLIYKYEIFNQQNQLVCSGETIQVFLDSENNLCLYNPEFFQTWKDTMGF